LFAIGIVDWFCVGGIGMLIVVVWDMADVVDRDMADVVVWDSCCLG